MTNIVVINGNPARARVSFSEALALAYKEGAEKVGHSVRMIKIADLAFDPILHEGYRGHQAPEPDIAAAQEAMTWAQHWVIVHPLWQFGIPALLKGFFERTLVKGFAYDLLENGNAVMLLKGKTVRLIETMGMPTFAYRWIFWAHGEKALKSMLRFCGLGPVHITYFGSIESKNEKLRTRYLDTARELGARGA